MHFQAYVCTIFVYRVVHVDMSTRSNQLNHLNLESFNKTHISTAPDTKKSNRRCYKLGP